MPPSHRGFHAELCALPPMATVTNFQSDWHVVLCWLVECLMSGHVTVLWLVLESLMNDYILWFVRFESTSLLLCCCALACTLNITVVTVGFWGRMLIIYWSCSGNWLPRIRFSHAWKLGIVWGVFVFHFCKCCDWALNHLVLNRPKLKHWLTVA